MKLEIASGIYPIQPFDDWTHSDCAPRPHGEIVAYSWELPLADESVDEIYAKGFWEHQTYLQAEASLKEWERILKPGGTIRFNFPPADHAWHQFQQQRVDFIWVTHALWGWQNEPDDIHRSGWTKAFILPWLIDHTSLVLDELYWGNAVSDAGEIERVTDEAAYTIPGAHIWVTLRKPA